MHHGGSFKVYMQNKNLKLQEQFEAAQLLQAQQSDLFKGVAVHVNGRTVPSHQELKQIMVGAANSTSGAAEAAGTGTAAVALQQL
jgi:sulfur carrier protein ThiS